jgi:uncharacterized C2H2 Zn-finger protein
MPEKDMITEADIRKINGDYWMRCPKCGDIHRIPNSMGPDLEKGSSYGVYCENAGKYFLLVHVGELN